MFLSWRAAKCDDKRIQFRFVCSTSICSNDASITPAEDPTTTTTGPITIILDQTTIIVATSILVGLLLLVVAVLAFKKLKKRQRGPGQMKTDENAVYGLYYNSEGERIDQGRVYAEDSNPDYYS